MSGFFYQLGVFTVSINLCRYSVRAKRIFEQLEEKPFVVELDQRGNNTCTLLFFFFILHCQHANGEIYQAKRRKV